MIIKTIAWSFSIYDAEDIHSFGYHLYLYRSFCIPSKTYNSVLHRIKIRKIITPSYSPLVFIIKQI